MDWIVIKKITVLRSVCARPEAGEYSIQHDCGLGCECSSVISKASGSMKDIAEKKSFCFNDREKQGISEIDGSAVLVASTCGVEVYRVQAEIIGLAMS